MEEPSMLGWKWIEQMKARAMAAMASLGEDRTLLASVRIAAMKEVGQQILDMAGRLEANPGL